MGCYKNFKTVVYIPAEVAAKFTQESLAGDLAFLQKYIGLDKVYLETHRNNIDVEDAQLAMIKDYLESQGVTVSGGITTTINDFEGAEAGKQRLFGTFCYTDPAMRARLKEISERTAGIFDEIILDDFYFTNCTCERCIREKGDRDWVTFRRELMKDVSENLVVGPAKAVNPGVRMIVKYPNWRESYHFTGYVPEVQRDIFDATYTGTETRSPAYTDQHLPEYLSYSLVRYMENAWPGRNGGGWFDTYACWSTDRYLEQAYLTAFAKAKELMHFQWSDLIDNPFVAPMGVQLRKIDAMMEGLGNPTGVPVYIPFASSGENHLEMRLGMLGVPMEPTPFFPGEAPRMLLTESSLRHRGETGKLRPRRRCRGCDKRFLPGGRRCDARCRAYGGETYGTEDSGDTLSHHGGLCRVCGAQKVHALPRDCARKQRFLVAFKRWGFRCAQHTFPAPRIRGGKAVYSRGSGARCRFVHDAEGGNRCCEARFDRRRICERPEFLGVYLRRRKHDFVSLCEGGPASRHGDRPHAEEGTRPCGYRERTRDSRS